MRTAKAIAAVLIVLLGAPAVAGAQEATDARAREAAAALPDELWEPGSEPVTAAGPTLPDGGGVTPLLVGALVVAALGAGYVVSLLRPAATTASAAPEIAVEPAFVPPLEPPPAPAEPAPPPRAAEPSAAAEPPAAAEPSPAPEPPEADETPAPAETPAPVAREPAPPPPAAAPVADEPAAPPVADEPAAPPVADEPAAAPVARQPAPPVPAAREPAVARETCVIALSHAWGRGRFEVRVKDRRGAHRVVASSLAFEAPRGMVITQTGAAGRAHRRLLLHLAAAGWEVEPDGDGPWYALRLSRPVKPRAGRDIDRALVSTRPDGDEAEFVALALDDFGNARVMMRSPRFARGPGGPVEETEPAMAAHGTLLDDLEAHGWRVSGTLESWYGATLARRRSL